MPKEFPVAFNFEAFESITGVIDKVSGKFKGLENSVKGVNNTFEVARKKTEEVREKFSKVGEGFVKGGEILSLTVTAPLALLAHHFKEAAVEGEEANSRFNQIFNSIGQGVKNAAIGDLRSKFDLADISAKELMATTGLFAENLNFTDKAAFDMSKTVAGLSVEIANFRGHGQTAEEVASTLQAALLGNYKALKTMGISLSDTEIKQAALEAAQKGARFETVEQAKAMAALAVIQEKTKDDQHDYAESVGKFANQQRVSKELFKQISDVMGKLMLPAMERNLHILNSIQRAFLGLSPTTQKIALVLGTVAASIGPILITAGILIGKVIPALILGWTSLTAVSLPLLGTIALIVAALVGLGVAAYLVYDNWEPIKEFFSALWDGPLVRTLRFITGFDALVSLAQVIMDNWEPIKEFFADIFNFVATVMKPVLDGMKLIASGAGAIAKTVLFGQNSNPFGPAIGAQSSGGPAQAQASSSPLRDNARTIGQVIAQEIRTVNDARVQVDFANAPRGTQVSTQATGLPPTLNLGMMGAPL